MLADPQYATRQEIFALFGLKPTMLYNLPRSPSKLNPCRCGDPALRSGIRLFRIPWIRAFIGAQTQNDLYSKRTKTKPNTMNNNEHQKQPYINLPPGSAWFLRVTSCADTGGASFNAPRAAGPFSHQRKAQSYAGTVNWAPVRKSSFVLLLCLPQKNC